MKIQLFWPSLVMLFSLSGCSYFSDQQAPPVPPQTLQAPQEQAAPEAVSAMEVPDKQQARLDKNYIEILWAIPSDSVDGYLIRYGYARDKLEFERKLSLDQVETFEDAKHGFVYRHLLEDIAPDKKLYLSLVSLRGELQSEPSEILEVETN